MPKDQKPDSTGETLVISGKVENTNINKQMLKYENKTQKI